MVQEDARQLRLWGSDHTQGRQDYEGDGPVSAARGGGEGGWGAFLDEVELEPSRMVLGQSQDQPQQRTRSSRASPSQGRQVLLVQPCQNPAGRVLANLSSEVLGLWKWGGESSEFLGSCRHQVTGDPVTGSLPRKWNDASAI